MQKILWFLFALILGASLGSIIQSVFNLQAIAAITGAFSLSLWLHTIVYDLTHFMPLLAAIFLPIMVLSILATAYIRCYVKVSGLTLNFAITALATWLALFIINHLAPMPTLIALNRSTVGTMLLLCCCASATVIFQYLIQQRRLG